LKILFLFFSHFTLKCLTACTCCFVPALQEFLTHPVPTQRFAAVRVLAEIVQLHPVLVTNCTTDLEHLIGDQNRSIATLAITTLLKTGVESSVERLMKSISGFMSEISDEFKIVVVDAVRALCLKFPQKHIVLVKFLSGVLREEGGSDYKRSIVATLLTIMTSIEEAREMVLDHLCEFIEDCEFPDLAVQILQVLADQSTHVKYPARFIRYVYNRVVLEVEPVRAGAVSALAKIGATNESLSEAVTVLLKRCMTDVDDEVRDRATVLSSMLAGTEGAIGVLSHPTQARALIATPLTTPLPQLDASLAAYLAAGDFSSPFGLDKLVSYREPVANSVASSISADLDGPKSGLLAAVSNATREEVNPHLATLNSIPEIAALGPVFRYELCVLVSQLVYLSSHTFVLLQLVQGGGAHRGRVRVWCRVHQAHLRESRGVAVQHHQHAGRAVDRSDQCGIGLGVHGMDGRLCCPLRLARHRCYWRGLLMSDPTGGYVRAGLGVRNAQVHAER
jgi:coatomer protein complex subunit gamma